MDTSRGIACCKSWPGLKECRRPHDLVARLGGNELVLVLFDRETILKR